MISFSSLQKIIQAGIISLFLVSCGGGSNDSGPSNTTNGGAFQGKYSGSYDGSTTGAWTITVDSNGNATGTTFTSTGPLTLKGVVNSSGASSVSGTAGATVTFTVVIDGAGNVTGTWVNNLGGSGNVTGKRVSTGAGGNNASGTLSLIATNTNFGTKSFAVTNADVSVQSGLDTVSLTNTILNPQNSDVFAMRIGIQTTGEPAIITLGYIHTSNPTMVYSYTINCVTNPTNCTSINIAANLKSITFTDTVFVAQAKPAANGLATGTLTVSGTANWK